MGAEYMGVSILVLGFVCFVNTRVSNHGITSVRPQAVEVQRQEPETEQQPQVGSMGWCQTPALVLYTPEQLRASETATSRFLDEFPQVLAATVSKFNLQVQRAKQYGMSSGSSEIRAASHKMERKILWAQTIGTPLLSGSRTSHACRGFRQSTTGKGWTSMTMSGDCAALKHPLKRAKTALCTRQVSLPWKLTLGSRRHCSTQPAVQSSHLIVPWPETSNTCHWQVADISFTHGALRQKTGSPTASI